MALRLDTLPPPPTKVEDVPAYLQALDGVLRSSLQLIDDSLFNKTNVAPTKTDDGMLRYADGTNWNPASGGRGYHYFNGTSWIKLQDQDEKNAASGYPGTDADNGIVLTGTPPAAPTANRIYKHPNAGGHAAIPITAADADAALAGVLTAAQGGIAAGALEGWHEIGATSEPAFGGTPSLWVNYDTTEASAAFRKTPTGLVVLKGTIKSGTLNTNAFILPAGYRPAKNLNFAALSALTNAVGRVVVVSDGSVRPVNGSNAAVSLDGIVFMAEA